MRTELKKETEEIFLYPAALTAQSDSKIVKTILGSCVAVCLYDNSTKIGGINHYMLPLWNGDGLATPKYGNIAIEKLISKVLALGAKKPKLIAKVFGGARVIGPENSHFNIGQRNIEMAFKTLEEQKIPILAQSTGGTFGRKIIFNTGTGEVIQNYIKKNNP